MAPMEKLAIQTRICFENVCDECNDTLLCISDRLNGRCVQFLPLGLGETNCCLRTHLLVGFGCARDVLVLLHIGRGREVLHEHADPRERGRECLEVITPACDVKRAGEEDSGRCISNKRSFCADTKRFKWKKIGGGRGHSGATTTGGGTDKESTCAETDCQGERKALWLRLANSHSCCVVVRRRTRDVGKQRRNVGRWR